MIYWYNNNANDNGNNNYNYYIIIKIMVNIKYKTINTVLGIMFYLLTSCRYKEMF